MEVERGRFTKLLLLIWMPILTRCQLEPQCNLVGLCQGELLGGSTSFSQGQCGAECQAQENCQWYSFDKYGESCLWFADCPTLDESDKDHLTSHVQCGPGLKNKILVATGDPNEESVKTEIIDLSRQCNAIDEFPNFPQSVEGAIGGMLNHEEAIVCGGYYYGDYFDDCVTFASANQGALKKLIHKRAFGSAVTLPDASLWIMGGKGGEFGEELSSTEIFVANQEPQEGPQLPVEVAYHCTALIDDYTVILVGGYIAEDLSGGFSARSFLFDFINEQWTEIPAMTYYRGSHGCSSFYSEFHESVITVSFGGWDGGRHIYDDSEVFVKGAEHWIEGPALPFNWFQMSTMTNERKNGLYAVGGYSKGMGELNTVYELTCPASGCQWVLLDQKLSVARAKHVAFMIYDKMANCTQ